MALSSLIASASKSSILEEASEISTTSFIKRCKGQGSKHGVCSKVMSRVMSVIFLSVKTVSRLSRTFSN